MNKMFLTTLIALITTLSFAQKSAIVDMDSLLRNHPNTPNDKNQVETTLKDYAKERDALRAELEAKDALIGRKVNELQNPMFGEEKKKELREEAQSIQQELMAATQAAEIKMQQRTKDLQDLETRLITRTGEEIQAVIKAYAETRDYDVVYYKAAVVYAKDVMDITKQIQAVIDAKKAKQATEDAKKTVAAAIPALKAEKATVANKTVVEKSE